MSPSIIAYRSTCTTINYLYQHPKFLSDLMTLPGTVFTVHNFDLTITCLLINIYSRIQVLTFQLLRKPQHPHQPSITVTLPNKNTQYSLFSIFLTVLWRQDGTYYRHIYNLHSRLAMLNTSVCYFQGIPTSNIKAKKSGDGYIIGTVAPLVSKQKKSYMVIGS